MTTLERTLELLLEGATNKDIAAELNVAIRTAKAYTHRIFTKHGITGTRCRGRLIARYRDTLADRQHSLVELAAREIQVIRVVSSGATNRVAATRLGTTENMVKNYLRNIYDKLGLNNRWELAVWYFGHAGQSAPGTLRRASSATLPRGTAHIAA